MKPFLKKSIRIIILLPIVIIAVWFLIGFCFLILCELGVCDLLPVEKISIYDKDGIVVRKILSGATSYDALEVCQNDSLIYCEELYINGNYISIEGVTVTDSIRIVVQEKIPQYHNSQIDSFELQHRIICLPKE